MKCPYCGANMVKGVIHGDRFELKWIAKDKDKGFLLAHFMRGIDFERERQGIEAYYCEKDRVIIIKEMYPRTERKPFRLKNFWRSMRGEVEET